MMGRGQPAFEINMIIGHLFSELDRPQPRLALDRKRSGFVFCLSFQHHPLAPGLQTAKAQAEYDLEAKFTNPTYN